MLTVIWQDTALQDLLSITSYIFERNPVAGIEMEDLFTQSAEKLANAPYMGRIGRVTDTREFVVHPNYLLIYKIEINAIHIIRILHSKRKYP